ncbi:hypothetical protein N7488_002024 [Penicillium malachiteum]|nr:hypothetical protein N7488_002024 [Penicillium malachiteum]
MLRKMSPVRSKVYLQIRGVPFRPYSTSFQPEKIKRSHRSTKTSHNQTPNQLSIILRRIGYATTALTLALGVAIVYREKDGLYVRSISRYLDLTRTLYQPSYLPIKENFETRLLVLEPGEGDDTIRCRFKHVILSDNPKYEALSYAWGDSTKINYITCDDKNVRIGEELFNALRSLREPNSERILWVDALCIDQFNKREKSLQVALMGYIYSKSQNVTIWLGDVTTETAGAFKALRGVDSWLNRNVRAYRDKFLFHLAQLPRFTQEELDQLHQYDLGSIYRLLERTWFYRVWTLQEMELAPRAIMVHGGQSMPGSHFFNPIEFLMFAPQGREIAHRYNVSQVEYKKIQVLCLDGMRSFLFPRDAGLAQSLSFLEMVAMHGSTRDATDPRDRIYAFSNTSKDGQVLDKEVRPDYNASIEEVYSRFARWCLVKNKDLTYLGFAGLSDPKAGPPIGDVPSWVADWTPLFRVGMPDALRWNDGAFRAGSNLEPTIHWEPSHPELLHIKGRVVDKIAEQTVARGDLLTWYSISVDHPNMKANDLPQDVKSAYLHLQEAQQTLSRYSGLLKGPRHMLVDVAWMESCKAIAKLESSPDRFDSFWQAMTRHHAAHVSRDLTSILNKCGLCLDAFWKAIATHQEMERGYTPRDLKTTYEQYARLCGIQKNMNEYEGTQNGFQPRYVKQKFSEYIYFLERVRDGKNWPSPLPATYVDLIEEQERLSKARVPLIKQHRLSKPRVTFINPIFGHPRVAPGGSEMAMRELMWEIEGVTLAKRFCSTIEGRLGWVPCRAQPGDLVCVFDGANMPYVIRPRVKKWTLTERLQVSFTYWYHQLSGYQSGPLDVKPDPEYVLVGQCYMHGLMGGEAMALTDSESKFITLS